MVRAILELCRISNLPTVWTNVIAAWVIGAGRFEWKPELIWLLLGASLVYCAGMILNDTCDVVWDRERRPERPIPSGRISLGLAWGLGFGGLAVGSFAMVFLGGANVVLTGLLVAAILLYDVYHKPWAGSVVVMGACRTLLYAAAGSAIMKENNPWAEGRILAAGLIMGFYIIGLSLVARHEGSPKKPAKIWLWIGLVGLFCPLFVELLDVAVLHSNPFVNTLHELFFVVARRLKRLVSDPLHWAFWAVFTGLVGYTMRLMRTPPPSNIGNAVGWLLAGIPLVDALAILSANWGLAITFVALVPLLRLWQRWVAAT